MTPIVLASASAARARLLEACGVAAARESAVIDEASIKAEERARGAGAEECALRLAEIKARAVAGRRAGALVLGADQMLQSGDTWMDKPRTMAEARAQLQALRGREHVLVTAAAVVKEDRLLWRCVECPRVTLRRFSDAFLDLYLRAAGDRVLSSVGGYELEGLGAQLMARVEGDYFAILGLPLLPLLAFLREEGTLPS